MSDGGVWKYGKRHVEEVTWRCSGEGKFVEVVEVKTKLNKELVEAYKLQEVAAMIKAPVEGSEVRASWIDGQTNYTWPPEAWTPESNADQAVSCIRFDNQILTLLMVPEGNPNGAIWVTGLALDGAGLVDTTHAKVAAVQNH
ncbi:hypothetical protein ACTVZO_38855 [Streptomyces sp. IBSNAI002]|uniref:hypothetical protein n=1 Tax=Streptomyces sp. IBSNAI002 TaxID=3457500 RepID=UPI003FD0E557